jgi:hypothetical protein
MLRETRDEKHSFSDYTSTTYKGRFQSSVLLKNVVGDHFLCSKMSSTRWYRSH